MQRKNIRLPGEQYRGPRRYSITLCCAERNKFFEAKELTNRAIEMLFETSKRHDFEILAYCFMPDHLHALAKGLSTRSNLLPFVMDYKRKTMVALAEATGGVLWQKKFYDHILRPKESPEDVATYILMNPVRAKLCEKPGDYLFSGSTIVHL